MVDVDRRMSGLNPAHVAGLRRLSARAAASPPVRNADKLIAHLRDSGIQVQPRVTFSERQSLFRCSESDPLTLKRQRSVSEKSAGSSSQFLRRSLDAGGGRTPRWVEFWSDAAVDRRLRNSPERVVDAPAKSRVPKWVERYVGEMGSVLREGGWCESDIVEISGVSASGFFEEDTVLLDSQAVLDALLLKTDRLSDSLRKAGWSSEEVPEVLGFEPRQEQERRPAKKLSPELVGRIGKLAESVSRS